MGMNRLADSSDAMASCQPEDLPMELAMFPDDTTRPMQELAYESNERAFTALALSKPELLSFQEYPEMYNVLSSQTQPTMIADAAGQKVRAINRRVHVVQDTKSKGFRLQRPSPIPSWISKQDVMMVEMPDGWELPGGDQMPENHMNDNQTPAFPTQTPFVEEEPQRQNQIMIAKLKLTRSTRLVGTKSKMLCDVAQEKLSAIFGSLTLLKKGNLVFECTACYSETPLKEAAVLSCKHKYCSDCLDQLVKTGCQSELTWPPQCCSKAVKQKLVAKHASEATNQAFLDLKVQCAIPLQHRWYCPQEQCAKPLDIRKARVTPKGVQCRYCAQLICVTCRQPSHAIGEPCKSETFELTMQEAERMKWKRCYKCGQMLELHGGCRHIKCSCKAEWCYICGKQWPTCIDNIACVTEHSTRRQTEIRHRAPPAPRRFGRRNTRQRAAALDAMREAQEEADVAAAITDVIEFQRREAQRQIDTDIAVHTALFAKFRRELVAIERYQTGLLAHRHDQEKQQPGSSKDDPAGNHRRELLYFYKALEIRHSMLSEELRSVLRGIRHEERYLPMPFHQTFQPSPLFRRPMLSFDRHNVPHGTGL